MVDNAPSVVVKVTALLVTPPEEAVIDVVPTKAPVARPLLLIVATLVALLAQVNVSPLMVSPALSLPTAVNWSVAPAATDGEAGVTVIVASAPGVVVKVIALLVMPPEDAVIDVVPAKTPVARPLLLIVATLVALLAQVNGTPLIVAPLLFLATAVN
jgi:hypothetical protein